MTIQQTQGDSSDSVTIVNRLKEETHRVVRAAADACENKSFDELQDIVDKIGDLNLTISLIGPAKSGKSTSINALLGVDMAPSETLPCTVLPTIFRHVPDLPCPRMLLSDTFITVFYEAVKDIQDHADAICENILNLTPNESDAFEEIKKLELSQLSTVWGCEGFHDDGDVAQSMEDLKGRLYFFNMVCRIFAKAELVATEPDFNGKILGGDNPLTVLVQLQKIHWPVIELEMESLKDKTFVGQFQIMDTPGRDETSLFPSISGAISQAIEYSEAAVCVLSGTASSPDSVDRIQKEVKMCSRIGSLVFVLVNRINEVDDSEEDMAVEAAGRRIFVNDYDCNKNKVFGVDAKKVS